MKYCKNELSIFVAYGAPYKYTLLNICHNITNTRRKNKKYGVVPPPL